MFKCRWKFCLTLFTTCLLASKRCDCQTKSDEENNNSSSETATTWTDVITSPPTSISSQTSKNTSTKEGNLATMKQIKNVKNNFTAN
jgi:hypothetical protein